MSLLPFDPGPIVPAVDIPIWNQYVGFLTWALESLAGVFGNGGLAIIAFTIIIKTLLMPLTVQSIRSSKAMQELQPRIKELQKKHGKDRQRLTQETMALYQQHRVNPMAGCLPMLLQIPIFLGLYNAILHLSNNPAAGWSMSFLWIGDLARPDPIFLLPVLAAVFQFVQTRMMRPANMGKIDDPQQAMMNTMMNFMPLTVILFGWNFAAGPVLYWATQSIFSVIQQWFITGWGSLRDWVPNLPELPDHKRLGYRPPRPLDEVVVVGGDGGKPVKAGGISGWFQTQMEKAQQMSAQAQNPTAATANAGATAGSTADAETTAETAPARGNGSGNGRSRGKANGARATASGSGAGARAGKAVVVPRKGSSTAAANGGVGDATNGAAAGNGTGNGGGSTGKAVIVPRKARPATGPGGGGGR